MFVFVKQMLLELKKATFEAIHVEILYFVTPLIENRFKPLKVNRNISRSYKKEESYAQGRYIERIFWRHEIII